MDNEMIERCVAAGVSAAGFGKYDTRKIVLAVIKAVREPTEEMLNLEELFYSPGEMKAYWYAMVDAVIND